MNNDKFRENIVHYLRGELDSLEMYSFETELKNNPALADEVNDVKSNFNILSKYPEEEAPQGFLLDLKEKIKHLPQDRTPKEEIKKKARFYANISFYLKFSAAVFLLFVLVFFLANSFQKDVTPTTPAVIGRVASMEGVVLVQNTGETYPKRIVTDEVLKDKQIIKTGANSFVNLVFPSATGESDSLYLQENTEIQLHGTMLKNVKQNEFNIQNVEIIQGSVYFDILSRKQIDNSDESTPEKTLTFAPFSVITPNVEATVRGTKFKVGYTKEFNSSEVLVSKGRVDVYNREDNSSERIEEGYFCVVGNTDNLANQYPALKNIENADNSIVKNPILDIQAEVVGNQGIKIILRNNFYQGIRLSYYENRDNIGIRYEFPSDDSVSLNWSPVRRLITELDSGEVLNFEYSIPDILRTNVAGDYYLQAVYSGNLEILDFPPFSANEDQLTSWRNLGCQVYSNRVAVVIDKK